MLLNLLNSLYWESECFRFGLFKFGVVEKKFEMDNVSLQQKFNNSPQLKYGYRGSFHSDNAPTLDRNTFVIRIRQPSKM